MRPMQVSPESIVLLNEGAVLKEGEIMKSHRSPILVGVASAVGVLAAWTGDAVAAEGRTPRDTIERKRGMPDIQTTILKENMFYVECRRGVKVPTHTVRRVLYGARDARYDRAIQKFEEGKYKTAARW